MGGKSLKTFFCHKLGKMHIIVFFLLVPNTSLNATREPPGSRGAPTASSRASGVPLHLHLSVWTAIMHSLLLHEVSDGQVFLFPKLTTVPGVGYLYRYLN